MVDFNTTLSVDSIALIITVAVIIWYTIETRKIRKATEQNNQLVNRQLELIREQQEYFFKKESHLLKPKFVDLGGNKHWVRKFENHGNSVSEIEFDGNYIQDIDYQVSLRKNEQGTIWFRPTSDLPFKTTIYFKNINGDKDSIILEVQNSGVFKQQDN